MSRLCIYLIYLFACCWMLAAALPAQAVVRPPDEWFDSPEKESLWQEMYPKLNDMTFRQQPPLSGIPQESLAGIMEHFGRDNAGANAVSGLPDSDPQVFKFDLNMDGAIDQFDVLELGYQYEAGHKRASTAPSTGTNKWVALRADFPNQQANYSKYTASYFHDYLFSDGTFSKASCNDYFKEVSYGLMTIDGTVSASGTGGDGWHMAQFNKQHYIDNGGRYLVAEAVLAADAEIDFSEYDVDGDGYVDTVMLFYPNAVFDGGLWPHRSSGLNIHVDGVIVDSYFITGTNDGDESWTMTITSHEYGHILGLPDLYDVNGGSSGLGRWCLMAYQYDSQHRVPSPNPWCKTVLGWVTPTLITDNIAGYSLPDYQNNPAVLRVWTDGKQEDQYFLLANYRQTLTDAGRPGQGLMIFHIDDSVSGSNLDNANELRKHVDVESARGMDDPASATGRDPLDLVVDNGHARDPFFAGNPAPAYTGVFDNTSNPRSNNYPAPGSNTHVRISNISAPGANMTFDIEVESPDAPTVAITSPLSGTQSGSVTVEATAVPVAPRTINRVEFYCNDAFLGSDDSAPYSLTFDSRTIFNGSRMLKAVVVDSAGSIDTDTVTLDFSNAAAALPYSDGFESGISAWSVYDPSGDRRWSSHNVAAVGSFSAGIGSTTTGYDFNEHDTLCSIRLDLSTATNPQVRWRQRYRVASGENTVSVWVSTDDGATSTLLNSWTGSNLTWHPAAASLADYIGQEVYLLFRLDSTGLNRLGGTAGWWIDALEVKAASDPPNILSITPGNGSNISGMQTITVNATDDEGVSQVDFLVSGSDLIHRDLNSPFTFDWNSDWIFNGAHSFTAIAYDADLQTASSTVNWTTSNTPPGLPYAEDFTIDPGAAWRVIDSGGAGAWKFSPSGGYAASGGMYMGMAAQYDSNEYDLLISPTVAIGGGVDAGMGFLQRYDIEAGWDFGQVFVTTNLSSWSQIGIFTAYNVPYASFGSTLSGYAGQNVKLAWLFTSDILVNAEGWYIDEVRLQERPAITGLAPNPVVNGQELTISGSGFGGGGANDFPRVSIDGTDMSIVSWSDTEIVVTVPAVIGSGDIVVTNHGIASVPVPVSIKLPSPGIDGLERL